MNNLIMIIIGYFFGSISFALIIGKVFYKTDIRQLGSGNLGGTNAGRTLGKKAGFFVIILDILKSFIAIQVSILVMQTFNFEANYYLAGLAAVFGHCYPMFANFKGGKGVATAAGFVLAVNPLLLLIALIILVINLKIHHMVSLGVMITLGLLIGICLFVPMFNYLLYYIIALAIFITFQHKDNIKRIINGNENKISLI